MSNRVFLAVASCFALLLGVVSSTATWAQALARPMAAPAIETAPALIGPALEGTPIQAIPSASSSKTSELDELLARGARLENEHRWGEALALYEEAARRFRDDRQLQDRITLARLHFELVRRYEDKSFRQLVSTTPLASTLDLFSEVLLKIQTHHVEAPNWKELLSHGARALDVALTDPVFLRATVPGATPAQIEQFRGELAARVRAVSPATRHEVRAHVEQIASLARHQLGLIETAVVMEYTCGAASTLDPYSTYLTPDQLSEVYSQIDGNFVGLGIELKGSDGALLIDGVITGSPAERAGIRAGDKIIAVNGQPTANLSTDQAANLLQGPEGSIVEVTVTSKSGATRRVSVRREQVEIPSIEDARIVDAANGVAYLRLACFQKTTSRDLDAALWNLHRQGMKSLIIDLRRNPGGLLTTSVEVVDKFVDGGVIVKTRGRSASEDFSYTAHHGGTWRVPLVVLIDGESASASEIFAGAIRDHKRGVIVGSRSYGKGSVQGIFPLSIGKSGLRLTTAKFYSPAGLPYSDVGVTPDVEVHMVAKPVEGDASVAQQTDAALNQAIRIAGGREANFVSSAR